MLKNWVIYYICLLASLVFVLLFPGSPSSAFFYALLALPVVSLVTSLVMLAGFRYEQSLDRTTAVKGDTIVYRLTIRNKCPLLMHYITASFHGAGSVYGLELRDRALSAPPFSTATHEILLPCKYRGAYEIGLRQIRLHDYLGFFSIKHDVGLLGTVTVYPRIVPIAGFPVLAGAGGESDRHNARGSENSESISDIRKYAAGDRLRAIHWKLSAKKEELMIKNFEQASGADVELLVDASGISGSAEERADALDRLAECAVSLAWHFVTRSIPVTLWICGSRLERRAVRSAGDFRGVYQLLSDVGFEGEQCLPDTALIAQAGRKTVVAIAAAPNDALCSLLVKSKSAGCMPVLVHAAPPGHDAEPPGGEHRGMMLQMGVSVLGYGPEKGLEATPAHMAG